MRLRTIHAATILLLLAGCNPAEQKSPDLDNRVRIRIHPVEHMEYKIPVRITGILGTSTQMKLSFKTGGILKQLYVNEGESVRRDEVLAVLDLVEIRAQVNQARIGVEKAERDLERAINLYRDSVVTLEQYQNARSALELARSQQEIAEFNLLHSRIKAPSDGKIQKILVETNEMIAPGYPALLFASTESDWVVRTTMTDKDIVLFSMGDSGLVTMDAFPGELFQAEITGMGTVADPVTGTYEVELRIPGSLPRFRTGFFCRVEIFPTDVSRSLVVPLESLLDAADTRAEVFVYVQGTAERRKVRLGPLLGDRIIITEGLREGESVITDGARYVREDLELVVVKDTESQTP